MAYFMLKAPGDSEAVRYDVPKTLTYGEQIDVVKELGQEAASLGVIWITVRRRYPETTIKDLRDAEIVMFEDDEADDLPPTYAAANGSSAALETSSTTPADTGSHGSERSTE